MEKKESDTETERNEGQREGQAYPLTMQVTGRHIELRRYNAPRTRVSLTQHKTQQKDPENIFQDLKVCLKFSY